MGVKMKNNIGKIYATKLSNSNYHITFYFNPGPYISLNLSNSEWRNLINFLKLTKSEKALPKDADAYQSLEIRSGRIGYFDLKFALRMDIDEYWQKEMRREAKGIKKFLTDRINILNPGIIIHLTRKDFFRFREACLNPIKCNLSKKIVNISWTCPFNFCAQNVPIQHINISINKPNKSKHPDSLTTSEIKHLCNNSKYINKLQKRAQFIPSLGI